MQHQHFQLGAIVLAVAGLVGCGGGSSPSSAAIAPSLSGTAAVGAPLPNATVVLKDANGKELTATADANGAYTFPDVTGVVAPIMLKATGMAGGTAYTLYSMASTVSTDKGVTGVVNVTPATDSVVSQTLGATSPSTVFGDAAQIKAVDASKLADAKAKLTQALKDVLTALGQDPTKVDLFTTKFEANNTGLDKLLDLVQVSTVATTTGSDIRVADKSTGQAVTLKSTDTAATVAPLPKPDSALVALDTTKAKNLLASFNALTGSKADLQSAAMKDLFDADFLDQGQNRDKLLANFWVSDTDNFIGGKMLDYVLGGCDAATKICKGEITMQRPDGSKEQFPMPVKQGSDGKWRAYGDQSEFEFDLKPVAQAYYQVSNGSQSLSSLQTGINLWIPKNGSGISAATLYASNDSGKTWTASFKLMANANCTGNFLTVDDGTNNCSNFKSVPDANAVAANAAVDAGTRHFKIVVNTVGGDKTYQAPVRKLQFTKDTGQAAVASSGLGIALDQLGSKSVNFTGQPYSVSSWISSSVSTSTTNSSGVSSWEGASLASLKGTVSVAAANQLCKSGAASNAAACDTSYNLTTGKIMNIDLDGRDATGRGVWVHYSLVN